MVRGPVDPVSLLPHRPPFLLLDRIARVDADRVAVGWKRVGAADCRDGDVWPGMFVVEALAQTAAAVVFPEGSEEIGSKGFLAGIPSMTFHTFARPGDTVVTRATLLRRWGQIFSIAVEARIEAEPAADGRLLLALARGEQWNRSS